MDTGRGDRSTGRSLKCSARSEDSRTLGRLAREHGMRTLMEDAAIKVAAGLTTVQEALRAARL